VHAGDKFPLRARVKFRRRFAFGGFERVCRAL